MVEGTNLHARSNMDEMPVSDNEPNDDRLDWGPRKGGIPGIQVREAKSSDVASIKYLLGLAGKKVTNRVLSRWMNQCGYMVRIVVRNSRNPIAICISKHRPDENEILALFVHPLYNVTRLTAKLLIAASLELPEVPLRYVVPMADEQTQATLRKLGLTAERASEDDATVTYINPRYFRFAKDDRGASEQLSDDGSPPCPPTSGG